MSSNEKIRLNDSQLLESFKFSCSLVTQAIELLNEGVDIDILIHSLAVNIGGLASEKLKIHCKDSILLTDRIIDYVIDSVIADEVDPLPEFSEN